MSQYTTDGGLYAPGTDGGASRLDIPVPPWREVDCRPMDPAHPDGDWIMDGVSPVPQLVAGRLTGFGRDHRMAAFGKLLRTFEYDFPGVGVRRVFVCEKYILVYLPENTGFYRCQGVLLSTLPGVLAAGSGQVAPDGS